MGSNARSVDPETDEEDKTGRKTATQSEPAPVVGEALEDDRTTATPISSTRSSATDSGKKSTGNDPQTRRQYEDRYGIEVDRPGDLGQLQQLERSHSLEQIRQWAAEGIPVEAMGTPSKMDAFRRRKDTAVLEDLEQRNERSGQRSRRAAVDTDPAGDSAVPDSVREVISSPGQSLDAEVERKMESRMGGSFDDVQIHTGPKAASAAEDIDAQAFTVGNHIAFRRGEYDPATISGQYLLAHELAHVRQQTSSGRLLSPGSDASPERQQSPSGPLLSPASRNSPGRQQSPSGPLSNPAPEASAEHQQTGGDRSMMPQEGADLQMGSSGGLEQEAEEAAAQVLNGQAVQRVGDTSVRVQRRPDEFPYPHRRQMDVLSFLRDQWDLQERLIRKREVLVRLLGIKLRAQQGRQQAIGDLERRSEETGISNEEYAHLLAISAAFANEDSPANLAAAMAQERRNIPVETDRLDNLEWLNNFYSGDAGPVIFGNMGMPEWQDTFQGLTRMQAYLWEQLTRVGNSIRSRARGLNRILRQRWDRS